MLAEMTSTSGEEELGAQMASVRGEWAATVDEMSTAPSAVLPAGMTRDPLPFEHRPLEDHFPAVPPELAEQAQELSLPAGSFCLFHSALLHGSRPSAGEAGRTSMVARLVRRHCQIPLNCAAPEEVCFYC